MLYDDNLSWSEVNIDMSDHHGFCHYSIIDFVIQDVEFIGFDSPLTNTRDSRHLCSHVFCKGTQTTRIWQMTNLDNVELNVIWHLEINIYNLATAYESYKHKVVTILLWDYFTLFSFHFSFHVVMCLLIWIVYTYRIYKLYISTARRRMKSPRSLSGTSANPTMVTLVNIMVMNGRLTSFSFHVNQPPHSWYKAISDSDLETPRSRSWVWSKTKVLQSAQYHIDSLPFHFTSFRPTIPEIELFRNLTLKHPRARSWVRSKVKVTHCTQYPTNELPFLFTSIGPIIPEIWPKECLTLKKHIRNF